MVKSYQIFFNFILKLLLKYQDFEGTFQMNNLLRPHGQYGQHVSFFIFLYLVRPNKSTGSSKYSGRSGCKDESSRKISSEKDSRISELYFDINIFSSSFPLINVDFNKCWIALFGFKSGFQGRGQRLQFKTDLRLDSGTELEPILT